MPGSTAGRTSRTWPADADDRIEEAALLLYLNRTCYNGLSQPVSATADFAEYSADGFGREDQERLLRAVERLDERDVHFVLSNSGVMYGPYDDAGSHVDTEGATRSINSDETARGEVDEVIVTNVSEADRDERGQTSLADY